MLAASTLAELTLKRQQLSEMLNLNTRKFLVLNQKLFYEQGNKHGQLGEKFES